MLQWITQTFASFLQKQESNVTNMVMTTALLMYFWGSVSVQSHRTAATPCHFAAAAAAGLHGCVIIPPSE